MERYRIWDDNNGDMDFDSGGTVGSSSPSRSLRISSQPSDLNGGNSYIIHAVGKYDTLAGVAIKYGVEVADIKRLNGLVTDIQMFALRTLRIPLPGKHPLSPTLCNDRETQRPGSSEQDRSNNAQSHLFDTFQSLKLKSSSDHKISPAMNSLRGYYGLQQADQKAATAGFAIDRNGRAKCLEDGSFSSPSSHRLSHQRKSKSVSNNLMYAKGGLHDPLLSKEFEDNSTSKWIEKLLGMHQKSEADFTPPEKVLKEESSSSSTISSRGLALRSNAASRVVSGGVDGESGGLNPIPLNFGDSPQTDPVSVVRKSSSMSSLQDSDSSALSALWPTSKWSLKPDFQALSSAGIPIFDGLPKPVGRKNKTALD